jgi:hypothetical protein
MDVDEERRRSSAKFEMKLFRRIYDPKYGKWGWKIRTNREL